jgi:hypothetical protein
MFCPTLLSNVSLEMGFGQLTVRRAIRVRWRCHPFEGIEKEQLTIGNSFLEQRQCGGHAAAPSPHPTLDDATLDAAANQVANGRDHRDLSF